jgi:FAD synthetase
MYFKVFVSGVFDNLHPGHLNFFKQALSFVDKEKGQLIVVIALDENVLKRKSKLPRENQNIRQEKVKQFLESKGYNYVVVLGNKKKKYSLLKKYNPDLILLGYDQEIDQHKLKGQYVVKRAQPFLSHKYKSSFCK